MRTKCPVCGMKGRGTWTLDFIVPDGWELPVRSTVLYCPACDFIWYSSDKSQADYDRYYINRYGFDGALNKGDSFARQNELVEMARGLGIGKDARIVDFGGGHERYIERRLSELGYTDAQTCDAGDDLPFDVDLMICSEVLEHIYDIRAAMDALTGSMSPDGLFLVELPDAERMTEAKGQMLLDYHQKHVNHFAPYTLDLLFAQFGYRPRFQDRKLEGWHFGHIYRVVYGREFNFYNLSRKLIQEETNRRLEKLKAIREPVVIWGCSDVCLYLLDKAKWLKVVHYVDIDPAYRGATIGGVQVLDQVESDAPIVVMAYNQQSAILQNIKDLGLKNKVIVI